MDNTDNGHLPEYIKQLTAENIHLKATLEEYQFNNTVKEREILDMKQQIATGNELVSRLDNELMQFKPGYNYTAKQKEHIINYAIDLSGPDKESKYRLQDLQQQNNYLQIHITELQTQVQELTKRNLLLQQQANRIAELESFLADAQQERDEWKALSVLKASK
jgi:DNA repair exonuclease SbcCD ATPase subunit